ncbi:membrane protein [Rhizobium leguminosarum bv. trifolii CB782]|uniref:DUF1499 domain-containing protein n=1 Tax=Rhizobium hidalgonense TaxID=1538159 RepID=A0ABX4JGA0_9HYPH|nr:DUF1499 domain-containing protein [Rhizobium hidalgonense]AHG44402.1 membrane protein [Rhizobium leguminosarum bv. trifolii CB782]EJC73871.1 Protein of unknown function (DUF1499) [Rhizobium leguminosarum bv. trifolii WSM2012]MDR9815106.1 DUF1499 domain-containing protein [Rhizobium hidalgonense]PDT18954.1 DUF1499 domain-containing protein [Rhizobium hidalgonense]PON01692.1 hypothetical protein ATY29_33585 [Rhizobium hidalgonense]
MAIRFDRPVSSAARFSRLLGAFSLVLALAVLIAHRFGGLATPYLVLLLIAAAGFALLSAMLAAVGLRSLWVSGAEGGLAALAALIYAAFPLGIGAMATERYLTLPDIYDVSTDPVSAPDWLAAPKADQIWLKRNLVTPEDREQQMAAYPELTGRRYEGALDRVLEAVRKVAKQSGFVIVKTTGNTEPDRDLEDRPATPAPGDDAVADAPGLIPVPTPRPYDDDVAKLIRGANGVTLQATNRTLILGLRFDILIRLREEAETTFVDIRVASRYGQHDLGFSAAIAGDYLKALDAELLGIAGG